MSTTFYAQNHLLIDGAVPLTPSHQEAAQLTSVNARNSGAAFLIRLGQYTGIGNRLYEVKIDNVFGPNITQATYRWSDTPGQNPEVWNEIGVGILPLVPHGVTFGLSVAFQPNTGPGTPQFVLGDQWFFGAFRPYALTHVTTLRPDDEYRSGPVLDGATVTLPWDLGSAQTPKHLILWYHNLIQGSTLRLQSSESSTFSPLEYNAIVPWASPHILYPLVNPMSARYWRLHITAAAGQTSVRLAEWYLGEAITMSHSFSIGFERRRVHVVGGAVEHLIRGPAPLGLRPTRYDVTFEHRQQGTNEDVERLRTLDALVNAEHLRQRLPFWVSQDEGQIFFDLVQWESDPLERHRVVNVYDLPQTWLSVVRSAA